jgi:uncharacterized protein (TIGR02246 family)
MEPDAAVLVDDERVTTIRRLVEDVQAAQSDVEPFLALHMPEAIIVNFGGQRVRGRDALRRRMTAALATPLADVITTAEVHDIWFIRPDVAIVSCTKHVSDERGTLASATNRGSLTYVVVDNGGEWRIALAQTTPIAAPARGIERR